MSRAYCGLVPSLVIILVVAYEPANVAADGKFRKIEAPIANRKGVCVRHRRGYYAPGT